MIVYWPRLHYGEFARREGCTNQSDRPEWITRKHLPKPSGVIGYNADQVGCFLWVWSIRTHYEDSIYSFALDNGQAEGLHEKLKCGSVLFVLPYGGWMSETTMMKELREQSEARGIVTISVPMNIARGEPWPIEMSMCISTRIEIARQRRTFA